MNFLTIIFNIIFGLSLGLFVGNLFKKKKYHGPNSLEVQKKKFKLNSKCYKLKPKIVKCPL